MNILGNESCDEGMVNAPFPIVVVAAVSLPVVVVGARGGGAGSVEATPPS